MAEALTRKRTWSSFQVRAPMEGLREWLEALDTAGVPCAVASTLDRLTLLAALQRMGLRKYFQVRMAPCLLAFLA